MTHVFDSEVSLHYWLLWPMVRRRTSVGASTAQAKHIAFQQTASVECGGGPMAETLLKLGHKTNIAKILEMS